MEGILGFAFEMTALALADTDPSSSALARQHNVDIANWLRTSAFNVATKGMYYIASTVDCPEPADPTRTWCTSGSVSSPDYSAERTLNAEALRSVMLAYADTGSAALQAFGNTIYNAMWSKPGTCPNGSALCVSDGNYLTSWDDGQYYIQPPPGGTPYNNRWHKYFGMSFGIGAGSDWPVTR